MKIRQLTLPLLVASAALAQAPVLVQQAANSGSNIGSLTVTLGQAPAQGDVLIVCHDSTSGGASTVSGGGVTNWVLCQSTLPADNSEIWAGVVDGGPSSSSLITLGGAPNSASAIVSEWHGISIPLDFSSAIAQGIDGSAASPAVSGSVLANANDLVISTIGVHSGGGETILPVVPPGSAFTPPPPADSSIMAATFVVPGATGSVSTSWILGFAHTWASATVVFHTTVISAGVSGTVFSDDNHNGVRDPGEAGVPGVSVTLNDGSNTLTATTDANGLYVFANVTPGQFTVAVQLAPGFFASTPLFYNVDAQGGGTVNGGDFGIYQLVITATVAGAVFADTNHNGVRDAGEAGVAGVSVTLDDGTSIVGATTDGNGNYQFTNVALGQCTVALQLAAGFAATTPISYSVNTSAGGSVSVSDFGIYQFLPSATIGGTVFDDVNENGSRNAGEGGIGGVTVTLSNASTNLATTTDANGHYQFANVGLALYTVTCTLPVGLQASTPLSNPVDALAGGPVNGGDFGLFQVVVTAHDGHGIGFWSNKLGLSLVTQYNLLPTLPGLFIVDGRGHYVSPNNNSQLASWLQHATARNMAYMLSAQFVAMSFNVAVGYVEGGSHVQTCALGVISIQELLARTLASLAAHPYTPDGSAFRAEQEALKDALDAANNNHNWVF
jgi:hypothetical protein